MHSTEKFDVKNKDDNGRLVPTVSKYNLGLPVEVLKRKMWQNTRTYVNFVGVLLNNATVRGFKTVAARNTAQPGYASEDKILQIKPHQNDFAQQYPSVTLILNKTMTEESRIALEKWKQERIAEIGEEEFNKFYEGIIIISKTLAELGAEMCILLHLCL